MGYSKELDDWQHDAHTTARAKGWWSAQEVQNQDGTVTLNRELVAATIPEKLCLIHSEVSEALEDYRVGKLATTLRESDGKPEGLPSELADIVIRVMDLAEALGINLEREMGAKMRYNATRPHRHGGKRA